MTSFEKAFIKQLVVIGLIVAVTVGFLPGLVQTFVVPACFAWGGALVMWTQTLDRNGRAKERSSEFPELGDFIHPILIGWFAAFLVGIGAVVGAIVRRVVQ